jgi:ABC-type antimicrobial peptide transport system permease subunit
MTAVYVRSIKELRAHWRAFTALVLLAGLPGGVALASAIGASRTDTVVDRLVAKTRPPDSRWMERGRSVRGVRPPAVVPVAQFGIVVAGSLAVAALIAVWPARAAARTEPALVLRAE